VVFEGFFLALVQSCHLESSWMHLDEIVMRGVGCQILLAVGAGIEVRDEDGGLPLHDACVGGNEQII
jgi:ankyrin repeat protein